MMSLLFAHPPRIELVAELKWVPSLQVNAVGDRASCGARGSSGIAFTADEQFFSDFHAEISDRYGTAERLVPPGVPVPFGTFIWRFQNKEYPFDIIQIGAGIFSANAIRPEMSWEEFRPSIEHGVTSVLKIRQQKAPFVSVALRSLDLFSEQLTREKSDLSFLRDVLGFDFRLADAIRDNMHNVDAAKLSFGIIADLRNDLTLRLNMGDGSAGDRHGFMMDMVVLANKETTAEAKQVMGVLDRAHVAACDIFLGLTRNIQMDNVP